MITVEIPAIGTMWSLNDKTYVIIGTSTYQEQGSPIVTYATILEVDANGDDAGKETITAISDILTKI